MTEKAGEEQQFPRTTQRGQAELIQKRFTARGHRVGIHRSPDEPNDIQFLYRAGHVLVDERYLPFVRDILIRTERLAPTDGEGVIAPVVQGVRLVRLGNVDTVETLRVVAEGTRVGNEWVEGLGAGACAPDHVVSISGDAGSCPATEPDPVPAGSAVDPGPTTDRCGGEGVRVVVIDTGFDAEAATLHPWLRGVTGDADGFVLAGTPRALETYAGHGTFIAGVVRAMAPLADVVVRNHFDNAGATFESNLVIELDKVLTKDSPDVISMSAGTRTFDATGLLGLRVWNETRFRHHKGVALVVAAGNDGDRVQFWPAAAPYTVSVGALATKWRGRAGFSNYGGWVDVYAPGQDLVNAYPRGRYTYAEEPRTGTTADFHGMARWSGTSFSTPVVAGLIAARMSHTGENGRDAAAALLATARANAQPGVGAVLLPE
jgi:hypothetical protein